MNRLDSLTGLRSIGEALRGALLAVLLLAGFAWSTFAQTAPASDSDSAVLKPGDVLRITVWRKAELSGEIPVGTDGTLQHPLYQTVSVAGAPMAVVRQRLREFLQQFETDPQFLIEPLFRVVVGGEVRTPNLYSLPRGTTISQAVALAGGPTTEGRLDRVHFVRGGRDTPIDLTNPASDWLNTQVESGDQILIDRRRHLLRDILGPLASLTAVAVGIANLLRR